MIQQEELPGNISSAARAVCASGRLWNRNFFLLWQGQTISQLGDQAFYVAMAFWTMEATGSASLMGLMMGVGTLPGLLLMPFGGTLADRYARLRIILVCDILSGLALLVLTGLMQLSGSVQLVLAGLFSVSVLFGILRSFFTPAIEAAIPDLVPLERLAAANSLNQFSEQTSQLLGKAVGGVLYQVFGAPLLFLFNGLSFLFAAGSTALISAPPTTPPVRRASGTREVLKEFLGETVLGARYVTARIGLRNLFIMAALLNFLLAPIIVLLPFYVRNQLAAQAAWYGYLLAALSAGSVAGFLLAGVLTTVKGRTRGLLLVGGLVSSQAFFGIVGSIRVPVLALVVMFAAGVCLGLVNIFVTTVVQSSTPNELRGRVFGLLATLGGGLAPVGMALAGWVGDITQKNVPLIFGAAGALSVLLTLSLATRKECWSYLTEDVERS